MYTLYLVHFNSFFIVFQLFDLLGFDRFQLIQVILDHRKDIVANGVAEEKKTNAAGTYSYRVVECLLMLCSVLY